MSDADDMVKVLLDDVREAFRAQKRLGDGALTQLTGDELHLRPDPGSNTVAVLVKHLHGNILSRWTDFLTTDGEKPTRRRDAEFEADDASLATVRAWWDEAWRVVLGALDALTPADLTRSVTIRGEAVTVPQAVLRQLTHVAYHVGQIVLLAKHARGEAWTTLSVPRGGSEAYDARLREAAAGRR